MAEISRDIEHQLDRLRLAILGECRLLLWAHMIVHVLIFTLGATIAFVAAGVVRWMGPSDPVPALLDFWYWFPAG